MKFTVNKRFFSFVLVSLGMVITTIVWISFFPSEPDVQFDDIIFEAVSLFLLYMGYIILLKLDIIILEIGWGCILFSSLLDVIDEFTDDPDLWGSYIPDILSLSGICLVVLGLFLTYKKIKEELTESHRVRKLLKKSEEKYRHIIENIEYITSNMLLFIKSIKEKGSIDKADTEQDITGSLEQVINVEGEVGSMAATFTRLVNNMQQMNSSLLEKERIKNEMNMAKKIQLTSLPVIGDQNEYQMSVKMIPADEVGGDFYDIVTTVNGRTLYIIGDVSGHGLNAGLLMFMVQSSVRTLVLMKPSISVEEIVCDLNSFLYENIVERMQIEEFVTFLVAENFENGRFEIAGFHPFPLIYRASSGSCEEVHVEGIYLGFMEHIEHVVKKSVFQLDEGDILVLYTDGIIEARSQKLGLYDYERYKKVIRENNSLSMKELAGTIIKDVQDFMDTQKDDMTLFLIKRGK